MPARESRSFGPFPARDSGGGSLGAAPAVELRVGDRVIVRRRLADTPGHLTDVIGHVSRLQPLAVRPQSVGGMMSQAPEILLDEQAIVVIKKLTPRRVLNSQIRAVELAYARAFPGLHHQVSGGWLLRAGDGITERSNSAAPLWPAASTAQPPWQEIFAFYQEHDLPPQLLIPERIAKPAEAIVTADPRWQFGPEIVVMTAELAPGTEPDNQEMIRDKHGETFTFEVAAQPDEKWLGLYHFRGQALPAHALELLRGQIEGTLGFGRLRNQAGDTVAITRGTITEADDGSRWLGYSAVEVAEGYRRRGLGTALGEQMMRWGATAGAENAYLQVISTNEAGLALYERLGFLEHHRHRYARRVQ